MNELLPKAEANDMKFVSTMWGDEEQGSEGSFRRRRKRNRADFAPRR